MFNINKILKPRYLLVLLVLGGGALLTMLQATSNECFSTANGDLTEQSTFGTYNSSEQSGCGSNLALDYIISQGNSVSWSGFEGPISGNVEVKSGGSLDINGNATFGGTLTNAGTLTVQAQATPDNASADNSTFFTISNPSGNTSENGTTSTFNVTLDSSAFPVAADNASADNSTFFTITNLSGNTSENGTTSTFNVTLDSSAFPVAPDNASADNSTFFTITNLSGNTSENGTTSTFNVTLDSSAFPVAPDNASADNSTFFTITNLSGNTSENGTTSTFNVALQTAPSDNVTVSVSSDNNSEGTVSPSTLTFTPNNWNSTQTVTVTGVDDNSTDGHQDYHISLSAEVDTGDLEVTTLAGSSYGSTDATGTSASFNYPMGITTDGTNLYVADENNDRIRKIVISTGVVTTLAGSSSGFADNATGTSAKFYEPFGVTTDGTNLYVTDTANHRIRKIVISTGVVTTLAGSGTQGSTDNNTGTSASFRNPTGITTDGTNLYVTELGNHRIRKIVISTGVVTTLAGSTQGHLDNATGTSAKFSGPYGITTDGTNLYVADWTNHRIRKIVISTGVVTTLAGSSSGSTDATGTSAKFSSPRGITTDGTNLYVADLSNHLIRQIE